MIVEAVEQQVEHNNATQSPGTTKLFFALWRRDHSQGLTVPNQDQAYFLQLLTGRLGLIWMAKAAFQRRKSVNALRPDIIICSETGKEVIIGD